MKVEAEYDALEAERECERAKKLEQQQCVIADCKQQYMDKICCLLGLIKPKVLTHIWFCLFCLYSLAVTYYIAFYNRYLQS